LKLSEQQKIILKFHNGKSVLLVYILFICFVTAVSIFSLIYLQGSVKYVSYIFSFLFVVEETLCCRAKGITASIHITRKAPEIGQLNLNSYTPGGSYCKQKLVKGEVGIFIKRIHNLIIR
jgi:hypothetical protein